MQMSIDELIGHGKISVARGGEPLTAEQIHRIHVADLVGCTIVINGEQMWVEDIYSQKYGRRTTITYLNPMLGCSEEYGNNPYDAAKLLERSYEFVMEKLQNQRP